MSLSKQYHDEEEKRRIMAEQGEPIAISMIAKRIKSITGCGEIVEERYDEKWFELRKPEGSYRWLAGVSDYCLHISSHLGRGHKEPKNGYMYMEVKLKNTMYKPTLTGGKTEDGILIPNYNCESYYLDVNPVHSNMNIFCENVGINKSHFVIAFVNLNNSEIRIISLQQVNNLIETGWNENPIGIYGKGYGKKSYLIPKDATFDLSYCTKDMLRKYVSISRVNPFQV